MIKWVSKPLFIILGFCSLALAVVGAFLPLLPTTPFALLAAFFFSKGSPRLYGWIIELPVIGNSIRDWNEFGVITRPIKILAVASILLVIFFINIKDSIPYYGKISATLTLLGVVSFVVTRPEQKIKRPIKVKKPAL